MDLLLTQEPASLYGGIEAAAATLQRAFFENKSQPEVLGRLVEESSFFGMRKAGRLGQVKWPYMPGKLWASSC